MPYAEWVLYLTGKEEVIEANIDRTGIGVELSLKIEKAMGRQHHRFQQQLASSTGRDTDYGQSFFRMIKTKDAFSAQISFEIRSRTWDWECYWHHQFAFTQYTLVQAGRPES